MQAYIYLCYVLVKYSRSDLNLNVRESEIHKKKMKSNKIKKIGKIDQIKQVKMFEIDSPFPMLYML